MSVTSTVESTISLMLTHLRANWHRALITLLSIMLVLVMISQILIVSNSFSFASIESNQDFESGWQKDLLIESYLDRADAVLAGKGFSHDLNSLVDLLKDDFQEIARASELQYQDVKVDLIFSLNLYMTLPANQDQFYEVKVIGLPSRIYETIQEDEQSIIFSVGLGSEDINPLPEDTPFPNSSVIPNHYLSRQFSTSNLKVGDNVTLFAKPERISESRFLEFTIGKIEQQFIPKTSGYFDLEYLNRLDLSPIYKFFLHYLSDSITNYPFLMVVYPLEDLYDILGIFYKEHSASYFNYLLNPGLFSQIFINFDVSLDLGVYSQKGLGALAKAWRKVVAKVSSTINESINRAFNENSFLSQEIWVENDEKSLSSRINSAQAIFYGTVIFSTLLGIPAVILGLFAGNFAINLIKKSLFRQIGIYKTRGMSNRQVLHLLLMDLIVFSFLASLIGFLLAHPLAFVALTSRGNFDFGAAPVPLIVPTNMLTLLVILGLFLGILLRGLTIKRLTRIKIRETEKAIQDSDPYWKRKNIDIILLIWGVVGLFFFVSLRSLIFLKIPVFLVMIFSFLMLPSPIVLLVGGIMFLSRLVPLMLNGLDLAGKKIDKSIITLSFKDLSRRKHVVRRAVLVIALGTSLALILAGIPANFINYSKDRAYYQVGSDFAIYHDIDPIFEQQLRQNLSDFQFELSGWSKVRMYMGGSLADSMERFSEIKVMFINSSNFADVGFYRSSYGFPHLGMKKALQELSKDPNNSAFVSKLSKDMLNISVPSKITINSPYVPSSSLLSSLTLNLIDEFSYWPNHVDFSEAPIDYNYKFRDLEDVNLVLVADLTLYLSLKQANVFSDIEQENAGVQVTEGYYVKLKSGNADEFTQALRNLKLAYQSVFDELPTIDDLGFRAIIGSNNSIILYTMALNALTILLFAAIYQQERWKDMGVERTLGMSRKQLFQFSIVSNVTFSTISLLFGLAAGTVSLQIFMNLFLTFISISAVPPMRIIFPFNETLLYLGMVSIAIIFGALLSVYLAARRPISNILKVE